MNDMMSGGQMLSGHWGGIPMLAIIILIAIFFALMIWTIASIAAGRQSEIQNPSAIDILNEKLASGEITEAQYTNRRKLMES